jgi:hypothetical protein
MYGVSLNKDGTTKVVCQRLEHPEPSSPVDVPPADPRPADVPEGERVG